MAIERRDSPVRFIKMCGFPLILGGLTDLFLREIFLSYCLLKLINCFFRVGTVAATTESGRMPMAMLL